MHRAGSADQYGGEPLSFSLAGSVTTDGETLRQNFPKILEAAQLVADLKEGEMLYLPSGWFHEVQSFSSAGGQDTGVLGWPFFHMSVKRPSAVTYKAMCGVKRFPNLHATMAVRFS
jgi:hypothetical protein